MGVNSYSLTLIYAIIYGINYDISEYFYLF